MLRKVFVFLTLVPAAVLFAVIPKTINYQAKLTDASGVALNGSYSIDFRIYAVETGGSYIWHQTKTVTVTNGLFDEQLDLSINGGDTLKFDRPYWITLEVGSDGEMSPREKLAPLSFSFRSIYSDTADYAESSSDGVPSGAYVAFPDSSARAGWTYTGCYEVKASRDTWSTKANMPTARGGLAAAAVNGKIYAIGGQSSSSILSTNEEYIPDGDMIWENSPKIPKILFLSTYPNPFNASLSISYFVPEQSMVSLTIYDVLGARLATLVNEPQPAGAHTVIWNAPKDAHSGIYFVRMNAGENVFVKRALLIK